MAQADTVLSPAAKAARALALRWLSQREYSCDELRKRLLAYRPRPRPRQNALSALSAENVDYAQPVQRALAGEKACADRLAETDASSAAHVAAGTAARLDAATADALIDWLCAKGYLSDQRFVASRLHQRSAGWGERRIRHELSQHGLALPPSESAKLQQTELERAQLLWARKFGSKFGNKPAWSPTSGHPAPAGQGGDEFAEAEPGPEARFAARRDCQREAQRQMRFLLSRGFSASVVRRVVGHGLDDEGDDD